MSGFYAGQLPPPHVTLVIEAVAVLADLTGTAATRSVMDLLSCRYHPYDTLLVLMGYPGEPYPVEFGYNSITDGFVIRSQIIKEPRHD